MNVQEKKNHGEPDHFFSHYWIRVYCSVHVFYNFFTKYIKHLYLILNKESSRSNRKAWLKITIFAIHPPFLLPFFFKEGKK